MNSAFRIQEWKINQFCIIFLKASLSFPLQLLPLYLYVVFTLPPVRPVAPPPADRPLLPPGLLVHFLQD